MVNLIVLILILIVVFNRVCAYITLPFIMLVSYINCLVSWHAELNFHFEITFHNSLAACMRGIRQNL